MPPDRRRDIAARLDPVQKDSKVSLQFLLIFRSRHAVDACRIVLARPAIRLDYPVGVDQMMQGCEHPIRMMFPRLPGYPLLFRVRVCGTQCFLHRFPSVALSM